MGKSGKILVASLGKSSFSFYANKDYLKEKQKSKKGKSSLTPQRADKRIQSNICLVTLTVLTFPFLLIYSFKLIGITL